MFSSPTVIYNGPLTALNLAGQQPGNYYYRVRGQNQYGYGPWSASMGVLVSSRFHGRVTRAGTVQPNLLIDLQKINGEIAETVQSVRTGTDGRFEFRNLPLLAPGQRYHVRYSAVRERANGTVLGILPLS